MIRVDEGGDFCVVVYNAGICLAVAGRTAIEKC